MSALAKKGLSSCRSSSTGARKRKSSGFLDGTVDEFMIFQKALSAEEMATLWRTFGGDSVR